MLGPKHFLSSTHAICAAGGGKGSTSDSEKGGGTVYHGLGVPRTTNTHYGKKFNTPVINFIFRFTNTKLYRVVSARDLRCTII